MHTKLCLKHEWERSQWSKRKGEKSIQDIENSMNMGTNVCGISKKYHRLGGLNNFFPHISGTWEVQDQGAGKFNS